MRDGKDITPPFIVVGKEVDLEKFKEIIQPGDQVKIKVLLVERMNFCGDAELLPLANEWLVPASYGE